MTKKNEGDTNEGDIYKGDTNYELINTSILLELREVYKVTTVAS